MGCKSSRPKVDNGKTVRFSDSCTFVPAPHHLESCDESQTSQQPHDDDTSPPSTSPTSVADTSMSSSSKYNDNERGAVACTNEEEAVALSDAALEELGRRRGARHNKALLSNALAASKAVNQHHEVAAVSTDEASS